MDRFASTAGAARIGRLRDAGVPAGLLPKGRSGLPSRDHFKISFRGSARRAPSGAVPEHALPLRRLHLRQVVANRFRVALRGWIHADEGI